MQDLAINHATSSKQQQRIKDPNPTLPLSRETHRNGYRAVWNNGTVRRRPSESRNGRNCSRYDLWLGQMQNTKAAILNQNYIVEETYEKLVLFTLFLCIRNIEQYSLVDD